MLNNKTQEIEQVKRFLKEKYNITYSGLRLIYHGTMFMTQYGGILELKKINNKWDLSNTGMCAPAYH